MRIVVVGGGVVGLCAAMAAARAGHDVVVCDQGPIPFPDSASNDSTRVARALHPGDPEATAMAARAGRRWRTLAGSLLPGGCVPRGVLTVLTPERVPAAMSALAAAGAPARALSAPELAAAYPMVRFPAGVAGVVERDSPTLLAGRLLAACAAWLRRHPRAELRPGPRVVRVDGDRRRAWLADGTEVTGDALLVAAGPWSRALLPPALAERLTLRRQTMLDCAAPSPDAAAWQAAPAMVALGAGGDRWLVPPVAGTPLRLSAASACREVRVIRDFGTAPRWRDALAGAFREVLPGFRADWVTGARDRYYLEDSASGGPLLVPLGPAALAFAACGGSSFKFAPLIGDWLAARLAGTRPAASGLAWLDHLAGHAPGHTHPPPDRHEVPA